MSSTKQQGEEHFQ